MSTYRGGGVDRTSCQREHGKRSCSAGTTSAFWAARPSPRIASMSTTREIDLLQNSQTNVIHNPESNMGNAVGCAPVLEMIRRGVRVGLGSDGYTCDMFESLKVANLLHKTSDRSAARGVGRAAAMLFSENARSQAPASAVPWANSFPARTPT
jgi:hypothetical protein